MIITIQEHAITWFLVFTTLLDHNCAQSLSRAQLFATPWTVACPAALTMAILPARILGWVAMPSSRNLPNSGIEPRSPELWVDSFLSEPSGKPHSCSVKAQLINCQTNEKTNRQIKKNGSEKDEQKINRFYVVLFPVLSLDKVIHCEEFWFQSRSQITPVLIYHLVSNLWTVYCL